MTQIFRLKLSVFFSKPWLKIFRQRSEWCALATNSKREVESKIYYSIRVRREVTFLGEYFSV